mgnify:CR=1 FL=1
MSGLLASFCVGYVYVYEQEQFQRYLGKVTWKTTRMYYYLEDWWYNTDEPDGYGRENESGEDSEETENQDSSDYSTNFEEESDDEKKKESLEILAYTHDGNKEICLVIENVEDIDYITSLDTDILFAQTIVGGEKKLKRLNSTQDYNENIQFIETDKLFLQVELVYGDVKMDIHKYLKDFYVQGNRLFDKDFLKYYLWKYFEEIPFDEIEWKINIIDNNVKMFTLTNEDSILLEDSNQYKVD